MGKEFIWMFHSLKYHRKELLSGFQLNGHTMGFELNHTRAPLNNSSSNQPIVLMDSTAVFIASYLQFKK